ncbi:MAG: AraC family transcriptional regulator [Pseudomonadota bacterium]
MTAHIKRLVQFSTPRDVKNDLGRVAFECDALPIEIAKFDVGTHQSTALNTNNHLLFLVNKSDGHLVAEIGDERTETPTQDGMLTFAPQGVQQLYDFKGKTQNTLIALDGKFMNRLAKDWQSQRSRTMSGVDIDGSFSNARIAFLVKDMFRTINSADVGWRIIAEAAAMQIGAELLRHFIGDQKQQGKNQLDDHDIKMLTDYVEAYLDCNIALSDLASAAGMDMFAFSRSFKNRTGITPAQFVIQRRIVRATNMLENPVLDLAEIAYACGFSSQAHMTSTFTKHIGISPGRLRAGLQD